MSQPRVSPGSSSLGPHRYWAFSPTCFLEKWADHRRGRVARKRAVLARMPVDVNSDIDAAMPGHYRNLFRLGQSISGFRPVGGNTARLLPDSNATIDAMVADIDAAKEHVHLLFYIWLPDNNGCKVVEALKRAAARGVTCRAMADDLGSRTLIRSDHWQAMRRAGVQVASGLPIGNLLLRPFMGRIDLRNHRKIVVIDSRITYCGSQNCADPEFLVKAKYAPWVDAMMRFEGPIARQNQLLFASDWMSGVRRGSGRSLSAPASAGPSDARTGHRHRADGAVFGHAGNVRIPDVRRAARADHSTPYYVPDESLQSALCTAARRGVDTTIIFPAQERLPDRRRREPKLLRGSARCRRRDPRIRRRPAPHQIADAGRRSHADRLGEHGPPQLRSELREQHPGLRCRPHRRHASAPAQVILASSKQVTKAEVAAWPTSHRLLNSVPHSLGPLFSREFRPRAQPNEQRPCSPVIFHR